MQIGFRVIKPNIYPAMLWVLKLFQPGPNNPLGPLDSPNPVVDLEWDKLQVTVASSDKPWAQLKKTQNFF